MNKHIMESGGKDVVGVGIIAMLTEGEVGLRNIHEKFISTAYKCC